MNLRADQGERLIAFLQGRFQDVSGKFLRKVLDANQCKVNGQVERFGSRMLKKGDWIELSPGWENRICRKWTFDTLYEDEEIQIVNKPAGWICDPKSALLTFGPHRFLVHRLDKETTGALILAKNLEVKNLLFEMFEQRQIGKEYLAIVDGIPTQKKGEIRSFLMKKGFFEGQTIWGSGPKGFLAITEWETLRSSHEISLLRVYPQTGRTHQIRVHMAEMGHPIVIDRQYAKKYSCSLFGVRTLLHAERLHLNFKGRVIDVKAPLFPDMEACVPQNGS